MSPTVPTKTVKTKEAKNFSKAEAEMVDVMGTFQHVISVIEKEIWPKTPTSLQREIGTRNTNNVTAALNMMKTSMSKSLQRTMSWMKRTTERITDVSCGNTAALVGVDQSVSLKLGTPKTVENAHNTADTKYSVYPVAQITVKCPTTDATAFEFDQSSEKETDFAFTRTRWTAPLQSSKQEHFDEISNKMTSWREHPQPAEQFGEKWFE